MTMVSNDVEKAMRAAELVFGLMDAVEADAAKSIVASDPAYAAAHEQWARFASGLSDNLSGNASPNLWKRIKKDVQNEIKASELIHERNRRAARRLAGKRIAACFVICSFIALVAVQLAWPASKKPMVTQVGRSPIAPQVPISANLVGEADYGTVFVDLEKREMTTILAQEPSADVTHELWLMASSGERHSLGILKSSRTTKSLGPADRLGLLKAGAKVGVSIEPSGGSPTGLPTSLIVASGDFLISPRF